MGSRIIAYHVHSYFYERLKARAAGSLLAAKEVKGKMYQRGNEKSKVDSSLVRAIFMREYCEGPAFFFCCRTLLLHFFKWIDVSCVPLLKNPIRHN